MRSSAVARSALPSWIDAAQDSFHLVQCNGARAEASRVTSGGQVSVLGERASPLGRVLRRRLGVLMPISLGQLSHSTGPRYPYGVEVLRAARGDFQAVDDRAPEVGCHAMLTWKCGL